jgi:hypothetical protein
MNRSNDPLFDSRIADWLEDDPNRAPGQVLDTILAAVPSISQRRRLRVPWRFPPMPTLPRATAVGSAVVALILVTAGLYVVGPGQPTDSAGPSPTRTTPPSSATPPASGAPTSTFGLTVGPGLAADGVIAFGLHDEATDSDRLFSITADGSTVKRLSEGACCLTADPEGRAVLVAQDVEGRAVPAILGLGRQSSYSESADQWADFAPGLNLHPGAWSADYNLAFEGWADNDPTKAGIYLSRDNGGGMLLGELVRLTTSAGPADTPIAFSPDGSRLLFVRETPGAERTGELYVINIDGNGLRRLSPDGVGVTVSDLFGPGASWSPDGTQVAFSAFDGSTNGYSQTSRAYVVDVAGGEATPITADSTNMTSARWSPSGEWIAYDADGARDRNVWLVRPDGSEAHQATSFFGACCAVWSPDSAFLLIQGSDPLGPGMFVASANSPEYGRLLSVQSEYDLRWRSWMP